MINRNNELIYVKRNYFLPFKPLLDYEYKKFGYKRCDVDRGKGKFFNTAYYVKHKERPNGLCDALYTLNLPFSYFRSLVFPILIVIFLFSMLIEGVTGLNCLLDRQMLINILVIPAMLISVFLSNMGYNAYRKNDTDGKLDRIMKSQGWSAWTSYKDNDPRFTPPGSQKPAVPASAAANGASAAPATKAAANKAEDNSDRITLQAANGENIEFDHIATIANKGKLYVLLTPTQPMEGLDDDECLVFEYTENAHGEPNYALEMDDDIVDEVMASYEKLLKES